MSRGKQPATHLRRRAPRPWHVLPALLAALTLLGGTVAAPVAFASPSPNPTPVTTTASPTTVPTTVAASTTSTDRQPSAGTKPFPLQTMSTRATTDNRTEAPAQPALESATVVSTWTDLVTAFSAGGTVQLGADVIAPTGGSLVTGCTTPVTLDLDGHNLTITSPASGHPAVQVGSGCSLTIEDTSTDGDGTLTANDNAEDYGAPGIGGISDSLTADADAGSITITGGTVNATGAPFAAGIGGAMYGNGGSVTISGGTVVATARQHGAGIGAGDMNMESTAGSVTITGGTVTATGAGGAGIGGGGTDVGLGLAGPTVMISGGTVTATGLQGPGIGGGSADVYNRDDGGAGGTVTITGGTVTAKGGQSPGIGGGAAVDQTGGAGADVRIEPGASVTVIGTGASGAIGGGNGDAGVGAFGSLSNAGTLTIPTGNTLFVPSGITVTNSGTIALAGTLAGTGTVTNSGTIAVAAGGVVTDNGSGPAGTTLDVTQHNYGLAFDPGAGGTVTPTSMQVYAATLADAGLSLADLTLTPPTGETLAGWYLDTTKLTDTTDLGALLPTGPTDATVTAQYGAPSLYAYPSGAATSPTSCPPVTTAGDGCSLAQALSLAESGDTVLLAADPGSGSTATFTTTTASGWSLATDDVTIQPDSGVTATLDGQGTAASVLTYTGTGRLTVDRLTVVDSAGSPDTTGPGGGIVNAGTGTLVVTDSTFRGNDASGKNGNAGYGGGILIYQSGTAIVSGSTFVGNNTSTSASAEGGGIVVMAAGSASVTSSTFTNNTTTVPFGGGIFIGGAGHVTVVGSTFVDSTSARAPAIDGFGAKPTLAGNLLAGDFPDCDDPVIDAGYNIASDSTCGFSATGSVSNEGGLVNTLNPLGNYGGATDTIPPEPGSAAVAMIPTGTTVTIGGATVALCPITDQRGIASSGACNAGSVQGTETSPPGAPTHLTATAGITTASLSWTAPANTGGSPITGYNIYQGTTAGGESSTPVNSAPVTDTTYAVADLTPDSGYYFTVETVTAVGSSVASNQASVTTSPRVTTTITSSATDATWPDGISDTATLTGPGAQATGSVTFTLYSDSACTTPAGDPIDVTLDASMYADGAWTVPSTSLGRLTAGDYYWAVAYSGDTDDAPAALSCTDNWSAVTPVTSATTTDATLPDSTVTATATVSGLRPDETGSVAVQLFKDTACTLRADDATVVDLSSGTYDSATASFTVGPVSATGLTAGTYYWQVTYNSDGDNPGAVGPCGGTSGVSTVNPAATATLSVTNQWIVDGTTYPDGSQPAGLAAQLMLDSIDTGWGTAVVEDMPATVAIAERTSIDPAMAGCTVTAQQITEINGDASSDDIGAAAYNLELAAGTNTVTVTNTATCTTSLTLTATVVGSADPQDWTLTAYTAPTDPSEGTPAFSGATGTVAATGDVAPEAAYQLAEAIDPAHADATGANPADYVQDDTRTAAEQSASPLSTGSWVCVALDASGAALAGGSYTPNANPGLVTVPLGYHVSCGATNRTAQVTLLASVTNDDGGTLTPSAWNVSIEPNDTSTGLTGETVAGAGAITAADTVEVHPGAAYALSEATADGSTNAYLFTGVQRYTGPGAGDVSQITAADLAEAANWTDAADPADVTAPAADGHIVLRVVNDDIAPLTLPRTGGVGTLTYIGVGALLAILAALGVAVLTLRRRRLA